MQNVLYLLILKYIIDNFIEYLYFLVFVILIFLNLLKFNC